jgi:hypothetical protein
MDWIGGVKQAVCLRVTITRLETLDTRATGHNKVRKDTRQVEGTIPLKAIKGMEVTGSRHSVSSSMGMIGIGLHKRCPGCLENDAESSGERRIIIEGNRVIELRD